MVSASLSSDTSTSFCSSPGSSATTLIASSLSLSWMFDQPKEEPNDDSKRVGRSKLREKSSTTRFISRCNANTGLSSSRWRTTGALRSRFQGIKFLKSHFFTSVKGRRAIHGGTSYLGPCTLPARRIAIESGPAEPRRTTMPK